MIRQILFILAFSFACFAATAQEFALEAPTDWNYEIDPSDILIAGEDFTGRYDSPAEQTIGSIEGGEPFWDPNHPAHQNQCLNQNRCDWTVQIHKVDLNWHPDLKLFVKRNGFLPNVTNGNSWQEITNIPLDFFNGTGITDQIFLQYSFREVTVLMDADEYTTQVIFTVSTP